MTIRRICGVLGLSLAMGLCAPNSQAADSAPATISAPAPAETAGAGAGDSSASAVRLKALERSVNDLKEQVFRTRARLNLLKETVLGGVIGASRCVIKHKNEMGATFRLIKVVYALDGVQIMNKVDDTGRLADMPEFDIYNGAIQPGNHTPGRQTARSGCGFRAGWPRCRCRTRSFRKGGRYHPPC